MVDTYDVADARATFTRSPLWALQMVSREVVGV